MNACAILYLCFIFDHECQIHIRAGHVSGKTVILPDCGDDVVIFFKWFVFFIQVPCVVLFSAVTKRDNQNFF